MGPMRRALRLATGAQHQQLDRLVGRPRDLSAYKRYLAFNTAFRSTVERALGESPYGAALQPLRIAPLLLLDCRDLGVTPQAVPGASLRIAGSQPARLAALYVIEGAALGARVLLRDAEQIGLDGDRGARHLARLAQHDGRWESLLDALDRSEVADEDVLTASARQVFAFALSIAGSIAHVERV